MECSLPGSSVHRILQARRLEWVAIPSPGDILDLAKDCSRSSESLPTALSQFNTSRVLNSVKWGFGKVQAQDPKTCPRNAITVIVVI